MDLDHAPQSNLNQQQNSQQQTTNVNNHPMNNVTPIATPGVPIDLEAERRKPLIANMEKIEREFQEKKELFFTEKIEELTAEYESINNGKKKSINFFENKIHFNFSFDDMNFNLISIFLIRFWSKKKNSCNQHIV